MHPAEKKARVTKSFKYAKFWRSQKHAKKKLKYCFRGYVFCSRDGEGNPGCPFQVIDRLRRRRARIPTWKQASKVLI